MQKLHSLCLFLNVCAIVVSFQSFAVVTWRKNNLLERFPHRFQAFGKNVIVVKQFLSSVPEDTGSKRLQSRRSRRNVSPQTNKTQSTKRRKRISRKDRHNSTNDQSRTQPPKRRQLNRSKNYDRWYKIVEGFQSAEEIDTWMHSVANKNEGDQKISLVRSWSLKDQDAFIKLLLRREAYQAIITFIYGLAHQHVYVYNSAMFALAQSSSLTKQRNREESCLMLLDNMDGRGIEPTAFTFTAMLSAADGPDAALRVMQRTIHNKKYRNIKLSVEVFHSAIYACGRTTNISSPSSLNNELDQGSSNRAWQTALSIFHQIRRNRLLPTSKTYGALLQVLARTGGQVKIAMSLMQELQNTPGVQADERTWGAAMNVCAQASDYRMAIMLVNDMQRKNPQDDSTPISEVCRPNLRHCSALLKALAKGGQDKLALYALDMMMGQQASLTTGNTSKSKRSEDDSLAFQLPPTQPDLVALNTVLAACSKAGNFKDTKMLFDRVKGGEFIEPTSRSSDVRQPISPDRISYHYVLSACRNPKIAKELVKEMRLSRRHRYGAIPPTSVTYAYAISVCQKAPIPDLPGAKLFLSWAQDDGIKPTVFMYSSAIWTAERIGDDGSETINLLNEMKSVGCNPNSVAYDGVISALSKSEASRKAHQTVSLYEEMKSNYINPTAVTFQCLVSSIRSIDDVELQQSLLERVVGKMGVNDRISRIGGTALEALISNYGAQGKFEDALRVFKMVEGFVVGGPCLRAMLLACGSASPARWKEAVSLLHSSDIIEDASGNPGHMDQIALSNAIIACCKADEFEEALNLLQLYGVGSQEEQHRSKTSSQSISMVALNALIAACGRGGHPDLALAVFNEIGSRFGLRPDQRSYRSAVIACNQAEHERRWHRKRGMTDLLTEEGIEPTSSLQWWECALSLLRRMKEDGLSPDIQTCSSAISACEAAGQWQRALGVLQAMMDTDTGQGGNGVEPNLYCFNAAISACEKGGAWVEALELYERMLDQGGHLKPNFVTLNSLVVALDKAGQKTLAESKYKEARRLKIVNPWRVTGSSSKAGGKIYAMDLHKFSAAMASAAVRGVMDSYVESKSSIKEDLVIVTGKGLRSTDDPVLMRTVREILELEYGVSVTVDNSNPGRAVLDVETLTPFLAEKSWR